MAIMEELDKLQKEIDAAKKNAATFEGRLQESMKRLKDDFGLDSIEKAEEEAEKLKEEIADLETDMQTRLKDLQETYAW
jgi:predicted  nucleic acid-binding Zn-ribbon protein